MTAIRLCRTCRRPLKVPALPPADGTIRFERLMEGGLAIRQGWNPSSLSSDERELIATALIDIADAIRRDLFEDSEEMKHFPTAN